VKALRGLVDEPVPQLVHYHCEQAQSALSASPPALERAQAALDAADNAVKSAGAGQISEASTVRIALLRARLAALEGDAKRERLHLESILAGQPEYAGLAAQALFENYRAAGQQAEALALLQAHYAKHPSLDLF